MNVYLDNAATTPLIPEVIEVMHQSMQQVFGNPSSGHSFGRKSKNIVETARKNIAKHFNATASEIIFTAGGSEADNLVLRNAVTNLKVRTIITSATEHHAVLNTIKALKKDYNVEIRMINITPTGAIDYSNLEYILSKTNSTETHTLVSLMHINNETGKILDLKLVADLCQKHNAYFHSDTVQGIAHFHIDTKKIPIDFMAASAHKFHGPKGVGFAYIRKGIAVEPLFFGASQERGSRAGTENIHSIVGMEKAMEIAYKNLEKDTKKIQNIKSYFTKKLKGLHPEIVFNGQSDHPEKSSHIILNVRFPKEISQFLFNLDLKGVAASGGSACQSGSNKGSHVLRAILEVKEVKKTSVRFSFSKQTTQEDIDYVLSVLKEFL